MSAQVSSGNDDERNECFYSSEGGLGSLFASHYSLALLTYCVPPPTHFCHSFIQSPPTLPPARRAKQLPPLLLPLE